MSPHERSTRPVATPTGEDPLSGPDKGPPPRLPHERDESADSQAGAERGQRDIGEQALDDLASGQKDTGRMPVTDEVYDRLKKPAR